MDYTRKRDRQQQQRRKTIRSTKEDSNRSSSSSSSSRFSSRSGGGLGGESSIANTTTNDNAAAVAAAAVGGGRYEQSPSSSFASTLSMYHQKVLNEVNSKSKINKQQQVGREMLQHLLRQLRPFQREAYDYATQGITYERQFNTDTNTNNTDAAAAPEASSTTVSSSLSSSCSNQQRMMKKKKKNYKDTTRFDNDNNGNHLGRNILLADEMGLGKTVTSLAIMTKYYEEWPLLILCPASLKYTWPNEIEKFLPALAPSAIYVVNGYDDADFYENTRKRTKIRIVVAPYSILQLKAASARCLQQFQFQCVIVDESHNLKQRTTQRTKLAIPLIAHARHRILLSGTPALARPVELWTQLSVLTSTTSDDKHSKHTNNSSIDTNYFASSYTAYTKRYCNARPSRFGWDVSGSSNCEELHTKLKKIMVRRLKSQVLDELPAKQRSIVPITMSKHTKERKECQSILRDLQETRKAVNELVGGANDANDTAAAAHWEARTLLMKAYQASGIAKVPGVCDYLVEWIRGAGTQKVLVFGHHKGVLDAIEIAVAKELKGKGHIRIDGSVQSKERALRVKKFQTSKHIRVAVLSMTAAGVGLTLTAASTVMFAELHWTPGVLAQCEDRCHRIGQTNAVSVQYLVCRDTDISVDMQLWSMLGRKIGNLGRVIDGTKNAQLDAEHVQEGTRNNGGQSVQDELQDFFADTSPKDNTASSSSTNNKTPVKGSIMSFFHPKPKKQQLQQKIYSATDNGTRSKTTSASLLMSPSVATSLPEDDVTVVSSAARIPLFATTGSTHTNKSQTSSTQLKEKARTIVWTCKSCTFVNTKTMNHKTRTLVCDMCQRSYQPPPTPPPSSLSLVESTARQSNRCNINTNVNVRSSFFVTPNKQNSPMINSHNNSGYSNNDKVVILLDDDDKAEEDERGVRTEHSPTIAVANINGDGDDDGEVFVSSSLSNLSKEGRRIYTSQGDPIVLLDGDDENINEIGEQTNAKISSVSSSLLAFSVSRNSGRITIHYKTSNHGTATTTTTTPAISKASLINFELEQILSDSCSDNLMEAQIKRKTSSKTAGIAIEFNVDSMDRVVNGLKYHEFHSSAEETFRISEISTLLKKEIKEFVCNYLQLREVEKKALQESERPFEAPQLKRAILRLMMANKASSSIEIVGTNCSSIERYSGGARERAKERMTNDMADATDMRILEGQLCAWCGGNFASVFKASGVEGTYCSRECAERGRLNTSGGIREQIFALEGGVCRLCGVDAFAFFTRISALEPAERLNALCNAKWKLPTSAKGLDKLLLDPKEGDFWEADHIQAVSEGGGSCGLGNIRTLCVPCHQEETKKLRVRLKLQGGPLSSASSINNNTNNPDLLNEKGDKRQRDIRTMFHPSSSSKKKAKIVL